MERVEIAVKMVITVKDMQTNEDESDDESDDDEIDEDGYDEDGKYQLCAKKRWRETTAAFFCTHTTWH